jgi:Protein of unknown function (DUF3011)
MTRLLISIILACSAVVSSPAHADRDSYNSRAYAPENLSQLNVNDQIRVIENEYREQSRGRQIPDDQLDFYLDQIRYSRWTFSTIRSDIATSLRGSGNSGSWRPPSDGNWNASSVICSSNSQRYQECRTPFRGRARLIENISKTRCIEGSNWGSRSGMVWVNQGCRARFSDSGNGWGGNSWGGNSQPIRCESREGRYQECRKPYRGTVYLSRQLSKQSCVEGRTWGQDRDRIWVNGGCRAEFQSRGNGGGNWNGYTVSCTSRNNQYKTCAWDRSRGTPRLLERLSGRCTERYDWGFDNNRGLWVANNCSARFGVR